MPAGDYTYTGQTIVRSGSLAINGAGQLGSASSIALSGGTLILHGGITVNKTLNFASGTVSVDANSTWSGPITVTGPNVTFQSATAGTVLTLPNTISGSTGGLSITGDGGVAISGNVSIQLLDLNNNGDSLISGNFSGSGGIGVGGSGNTLISGNLTSGGISKNGGGVLTLSGNNETSFGISIYGGTVVLRGGHTVADNASIQLYSNSVLQLLDSEGVGSFIDYSTSGAMVSLGANDLTFKSGDAYFYAANITGTGHVIKQGSGTLSLFAPNSFTGGFYLDRGTLKATADNVLGAPSAPLTFRGGTLLAGYPNFTHTDRDIIWNTGDIGFNIANDTGSFTVSQSLNGPGSLIKTGAGTLYLSAVNAYSGGTMLSEGKISVSTDAALGQAGTPITQNGGTLQITGTTFSSTPRPIINSTGGFGFDIADPNATFTFSQPVIGVLKQGTGTLVLANSSTASGNAATSTQVSAGTLRLGAPNALASAGIVQVGIGATLDLNGFDQSLTNLFIYTGTVSSGAGTLTVTNQFLTNLPGGKVLGNVSLGGNTVNFVVANSVAGTTASLDFSAAISNGAVAKSGSGTLIFSGMSTYAGSTAVNAGTLSVNGSLSNHAAVQVAATGTLEITGAGSVSVGSVTNGGRLRLEGTATLSATGSIVNNGTLDLINWSGTLPANFVNGATGKIINASNVRVTKTTRTGGSVQVIAQAYAGHTYQLQYSASLSAPNWLSISGQVNTPTADGLLTFTDAAHPADAQGFYRVQVSP